MNLDELISEAERIASIGCSDGYCKFTGKAKGQHTNGGCKCSTDPNGERRSPYDDMLYMVNLLRLIALKYREEKFNEYCEASQELAREIEQQK